MTLDEFRLTHSRLIMQMQCIESDLRIIYAAIKTGDFAENYDDLEKANLGKIQKELKKIDYSDDHPDLSEADYELIDQIRETRNYWCHQCYLDYVYILDDERRAARFQEIAARLAEDEEQAWQLQKKLERLRLVKLKEYHRI